MINYKGINTFHTIGNIKLEKGEIFKYNYNKLYNKRKNISKNHFLLKNAFNITRLTKNKTTNKNEIPEEFYLDPKKDNYAFNIYNYKNIITNVRSKKSYENNEELLQTLLNRFDTKNIEALLKEKEKIIYFRKRLLNGIYPNCEPLRTIKNKRKTSFNKANSVKSISNKYNHSNCKTSKSKESMFFNNSSKIKKKSNTISIEAYSNYARNKYNRNYSIPKTMNSDILKKKLKGLFHVINTEEKKAKSNSKHLNTLYGSNINYNTLRFETMNNKIKTINTERNKNNKNNNVIKNLDKIKKLKDIDNILFEPNKNLFNEIKIKLLKQYKDSHKIPKVILEEKKI